MSEELLKYLDGSDYHDILNDDVNDNINEVLRKLKNSYKHKIPDHATATEVKFKRKKKYLKRKFKKMLKDDILH